MEKSVFTQIILIQIYNSNLNPMYVLNSATFTQLCSELTEKHTTDIKTNPTYFKYWEMKWVIIVLLHQNQKCFQYGLKFWAGHWRVDYAVH